jgi:hypothetical protein
MEACFDLTRWKICPCSILSKIDQMSIVLCLHLKGLSAQAVHGDLVATFDPMAVGCDMVISSIDEVRLDAAEVTFDPEPSSLRLNDADADILVSLEEQKSRLRPCENLPEPPMSSKLNSIEGSITRSGSYDIFFAGWRNFCERLRRRGLYCECMMSGSGEPGMTL